MKIKYTELKQKLPQEVDLITSDRGKKFQIKSLPFLMLLGSQWLKYANIIVYLFLIGNEMLENLKKNLLSIEVKEAIISANYWDECLVNAVNEVYNIVNTSLFLLKI